MPERVSEPGSKREEEAMKKKGGGIQDVLYRRWEWMALTRHGEWREVTFAGSSWKPCTKRKTSILRESCPG
jgi:hypothetical protein